MEGYLMKWIEWVNNVRSDAKAAYALALVEKHMSEIENYDWFKMVREAVDKCWKWVEEKQYSGDDLYETADNEEEDGLIYIEGMSFAADNAYGPQAELIWSCAVDAVLYTARQAYEMKGEAFPQPVGINDDEFMDEEFNQKIKKVNGYKEEWSERLKEYLLENHPTGSDKKIKRDELLKLIS
ncbi:Imm6 family immunity protein [Thermoactinomyces sp. FSL K6-2592]|uniref:Imm6 family immunity protein n=2 Tax=Thermoactinomycetaceae TaxID=186824 RepID=UPI0030F54C83